MSEIETTKLLNRRQKELLNSNLSTDEQERFRINQRPYLIQTAEGGRVRILGSLWSKKYTEESFYKKFPQLKDTDKTFTFVFNNNKGKTGKPRKWTSSYTMCYETLPSTTKIREGYLKKCFALDIETGYMKSGGIQICSIPEASIKEILEVKE